MVSNGGDYLEGPVLRKWQKNYNYSPRCLCHQWRPKTFPKSGGVKFRKNVPCWHKRLSINPRTINRSILTPIEHIKLLSKPKTVPQPMHCEKKTSFLKSPARTIQLSTPKPVQFLHTWREYWHVLPTKNLDQMASKWPGNNALTVKDANASFDLTNQDVKKRQKAIGRHRKVKQRCINEKTLQLLRKNIFQFSMILANNLCDTPLKKMNDFQVHFSLHIARKLRHCQCVPNLKTTGIFERGLWQAIQLAAIFATNIIAVVANRSETSIDYESSSQDLSEKELPERIPLSLSTSLGFANELFGEDIEGELIPHGFGFYPKISREKEKVLMEMNEIMQDAEQILSDANYMLQGAEDFLPEPGTYRGAEQPLISKHEFSFDALITCVSQYYDTKNKDSELRVFSAGGLPPVRYGSMLENLKKIQAERDRNKELTRLKDEYERKLKIYVNEVNPQQLDSKACQTIEIAAEHLAKATIGEKHEPSVSEVSEAIFDISLQHSSQTSIRTICSHKSQSMKTKSVEAEDQDTLDQLNNEPEEITVEPVEVEDQNPPDQLNNEPEPITVEAEDLITPDQLNNEPEEITAEPEEAEDQNIPVELNDESEPVEAEDQDTLDQLNNEPESITTEPEEVEEVEEVEENTPIELEPLTTESEEAEDQNQEFQLTNESEPIMTEPVNAEDLNIPFHLNIMPHADDMVCCASVKAWASWIQQVADNNRKWCIWMLDTIDQLRKNIRTIRGEVKDEHGKPVAFKRQQWTDFVVKLDGDVVQWRHYNQHIQKLGEQIARHFHLKRVGCCYLCERENYQMSDALDMDHTCEQLSEAMDTMRYWNKWLAEMVNDMETVAGTINVGSFGSFLEVTNVDDLMRMVEGMVRDGLQNRSADSIDDISQYSITNLVRGRGR